MRQTKPLVCWSAPWAAPWNVVERLREVDPSAELCYIGLGEWALGSVQPHAWRARRARELRRSNQDLPAEDRRPGLYLFSLLLEQGFRVVAMYPRTEVEDGRMVRDFRERDWNYRNRPDEAFHAAMLRSDREGDVERRIVQILDMVHAEFPQIHRHLFRGRRGVLNPGLN